MPRATKKTKKASAVSASSRPSKQRKKSGGISLFENYANKLSGVIDPGGIKSICADIGVPHTDIRILILAWKMKSQRRGYFSQEEWTNCMEALGVDTLEKLKNVLPILEKEAAENFADFYSCAYRYCLTEKQKNLDIETTCALMDFVLGSKYLSQVCHFKQYLKLQSDYKVISFDQWMAFLFFCNEIKFPGMRNYVPSCAWWPLILDNFVHVHVMDNVV